MKRLSEFADKYKKLEDDNKFDEAIQEVENAMLYIQAKLDGVLNFMDKEVLRSYSRDYQVLRKTIRTNKRLFQLEERVDNLSSQIGRLTGELDEKSKLR